MRPDLLVMGDPQSKDVGVVRQMAAAFGLPFNHVELEAREYVDRAIEICRLTNGVKPVDHWHSYFLASKAGYTRADHVMTGNNGEHVRAAGFDYGLLAVGLDRLSRHDGHLVSDALLAKLWRMKSHVILRPDEMRRCAPAFASYYGSRRQTQKLMSVMPPDESFVWQSDAFVLQQRRRVFQACGLRLMSVHFFPYSPYMRKPWVDAAWRLGLSWRLGSRWHRHAVERLCPALLAFPEEKEARHMLRRQRPLAWVPYVKKIYRRPSAVPYMNYTDLLRSRDVVGMLGDHASQLDDVIPKAVVDAIVDEQLRTGTRSRLVAVLTSMAVWRAAVRRAPVAQRPIGGQAAVSVAATSGAA
jgi:asparagine synthase (glutamine-hydrolysing)